MHRNLGIFSSDVLCFHPIKLFEMIEYRQRYKWIGMKITCDKV